MAWGRLKSGAMAEQWQAHATMHEKYESYARKVESDSLVNHIQLQNNDFTFPLFSQPSHFKYALKI
jgi:hypothetical protein